MIQNIEALNILEQGDIVDIISGTTLERKNYRVLRNEDGFITFQLIKRNVESEPIET